MAKFASRCGNSLRFRLRFKKIACDYGCDAMVHLDQDITSQAKYCLPKKQETESQHAADHRRAYAHAPVLRESAWHVGECHENRGQETTHLSMQEPSPVRRNATGDHKPKRGLISRTYLSHIHTESSHSRLVSITLSLPSC